MKFIHIIFTLGVAAYVGTVNKVTGLEKSIGTRNILRHRKLPKGNGVAGTTGGGGVAGTTGGGGSGGGCMSLGESCGTVTINGENITYGDCCSGGTDERLICPYNECCLSDGSSGCDTPYDSRCCSNLCNVTLSICINETRISDEDDNFEERECGIKGNTCIFNSTTNTSDCCGDIKYGCSDAIIDINTSLPCYDDFYCCMPDGGKGCGDNCHCCSGNCVDSTCIGADANGGRECPLKGDPCNITVNDCCGESGDIRMDCIETSDGSEDGICCIYSNVQGCEHDTDCCSGYCDTEASTCCIPLLATCNIAYPDECCSGGCVGGACCIKNGDTTSDPSGCCSGTYDGDKCCLPNGSPCGDNVDPSDCCGTCTEGRCV